MNCNMVVETTRREGGDRWHFCMCVIYTNPYITLNIIYNFCANSLASPNALAAIFSLIHLNN